MGYGLSMGTFGMANSAARGTCRGFNAITGGEWESDGYICPAALAIVRRDSAAVGARNRIDKGVAEPVPIRFSSFDAALKQIRNDLRSKPWAIVLQ